MHTIPIINITGDIMLETYEQHSRTKLIATVVAVVIIAGIAVITDQLKQGSTTNSLSILQPTNSTANTTNNSSSTATTPSSYKDGTYTASSEYYVPNGYESIKVSLTVQSGVITNSSVTNSEGDRTSARFQQDFASVYKRYVVGKKVSDLQLYTVAGASDTTQGFDDAVNQIASQAQA